MNVCLFCGTFNPIHNAHIRVAKHILDKYKFEKIVFVPTFVAPHKEIIGATAYERLEMVKLATSQSPLFEVSDIEFNSIGKSYTLNTILKLNELSETKEKWPFIIGTDAFRQIKSWYHADELKKMLKFIVLTRDNNFNAQEFEYLKNDGYNFEFTNLDFCDISSTEIRQKIQNGEDISKLVAPEVKNYIYEHGLYKN